MCMVRLPSGEEHGQTRHEGRECANVGCPQAHGGRLEKACQRAVERVDAMVKQFTEGAGGPRAPSLLSINVIHRRISPDSCGETVA